MRSDLTVPVELREQVNARGIVIADWRDAYERARAKTQELNGLLSQSATTINSLSAERDTFARPFFVTIGSRFHVSA